VRCQIWHDTNHRKDILGSVYHRFREADQNWDGSQSDPSPRRDVAVPLLIPFIGAETRAPSSLTSDQPATGSGEVVDEEEVTQLLIQGHGPFLALCKCCIVDTRGLAHSCTVQELYRRRKRAGPILAVPQACVWGDLLLEMSPRIRISIGPRWHLGISGPKTKGPPLFLVMDDGSR
jgi:hypothetical protein